VSDRQALLAQASAAAAAGRAGEAIDLLEALLEREPDFAEAHVMLGSLRHARGELADARDSYLLAACHRPDWWSPHLQLGLLALDEDRLDDAVPALSKAMDLGAPGARAQAALGAACLKMGQVTEAVGWLRKALRSNPDHAPAHSNLGYALFKQLEEYEEGAWHIQRAVELAPGDIAAQCNLMMVLQHQNRAAEALAVADRVLHASPDLTEARVNRALIRLKHGELAQGWDDYEARRALPGEDRGADMPWPDWDGTSLEGRAIFLYGEQGLGDEIMFASCIPDVLARARRCVVECRPKLESLFRRSFPRARVIPTEAWRHDRELLSQPPDVKIPMGSLPRFLRRRPADFPRHTGYLRADAARIAAWDRRLRALPGRRKVGISWRGGLSTTRRSVRSIPLADWRALLAIPGVDFVSLQYADPSGEIEAFAGEPNVTVHHWPEAIEDYDDTAALVSALDLVVSVQTAVVHLAGALGKPVWALIPHVPEWRYGATGETMPWYPSARLLRQQRPGAWEPVLRRARDELWTWSAAPSD